MPVSFVGLDRLAYGEPRSVVSAMVELGGALHVLGSPDHHADQRWVTDVRSRMSPELSDETACWSWTTTAVRSRVFVGQLADVENAEDVPWVLARTSPHTVAADLLPWLHSAPRDR